MKKNLFLIACMALTLLLLPSCSTRKKIAYLNDMEQGKSYPYNSNYEAVVHKNDRLNIVVSCTKPALALPFNTQGQSIQVTPNGDVTTSSSGAADNKGYRVDPEGNIDFPMLGKIYVEGLKVSEVTNLIRDRIIQGGYIKDPQVSLEFLNFKYTMLGAIGSPGTYTVSDDRITLLEAIAKAGDLTRAAKLDKISVIREINGERRIYDHDIRSQDIFYSPCYYLQQNDIVYVEPKYRKKDSEERGWQISTFLVSIGSLITSIFWVLK